MSDAKKAGAVVAGGTLVGVGVYALYKYFWPKEEATARATGTVSDATTYQGIEGALVMAIPADGGKVDSTLTDAAGSFTLNLVPGQYFLTASKPPEYFEEQSETFTLAAGDTYVWNVSLTPIAGQGTLYGTVTDSITGEPLEGAHVGIWLSPDHSVYSADTDADGNYEIGNINAAFGGSEYNYHSWRDAEVEYFATFGSVTVYPDISTRLDIQLEKRVTPPMPIAGEGTLKGTVTNAETGLPIAGVTLTLMADFPNTFWEYEIYTDANGYYESRVNVAGVYQDSDLVAIDTPYGIHTYHPDYETLVVADGMPVVRLDEETTYNIALTPIVTAVRGRIYGEVVDSVTYDSLGGTEVWIYATGLSRSTYANAYGEYEFAELLATEPGYIYELWFYKEGYETLTLYDITLAAGEEKQVNAELTPIAVHGYATLYGTVTDKNTGYPIAEAWVAIATPDEAYSFEQYADGQGRYRFETVPALTYDFYAQDKYGQNYKYLIIRNAVTLSPEETREFNVELGPK